MDQKRYALNVLSDLIESAYEAEEDPQEITFGMTTANMIYNVLNAQEIKEPLSDVIFFAGKPQNDTRCYHVLVNDEDLEDMKRDSNIHFMMMKKFTGVMDQYDKLPVKPIWVDTHHAYCGECRKRLQIKYRPFFCHKCGRRIDYGKD